MEYRPLDLTIVSAKDLKNASMFGKMKAYAVVSLSNDPRSAQRTFADKEGGASPTWNSPMKFHIPAAYSDGLVLHIQIRSARAFGDCVVGEVHVPVRELLDSSGASSTASSSVSYQVRKPSGKPKGTLNISYKVGEKFAPAPAPVLAPAAQKSGEPVTAYPASVSTAYPPPPVAYPPPPHAAAYPYQQQPYAYANQQPQPAYGYQQPPAYGGYGYAQPQPPKKNKFGMGLGAGLLGGALGGVLIGDMMSNSCDAGFDDGFDF